MPRHIDAKVEGRIIAAARKLWHAGGEEALSMRAIARAAGTNTPAVYRRFRDREDILRALVASYQEQLFRELEPSRSLPELLERVLGFALGQPQEYGLMTSGLLARVTKTRPAVEMAIVKATQWLGGSVKENRSLVMAVWSMTHGLIMLRISGTMNEEDFPIARAAYYKAVEFLVENREQFSEGMK
jgi:AcrR family transcriptional regulator